MFKPDWWQSGIWINRGFWKCNAEFKRNHTAVFKVLVLRGLCSEHQITLHDQSVKQILSGYFYGLSRHFCILLGGLMLPPVLRSRSEMFSHTDEQTKVKTAVNVVEIWICFKTLLKMLLYSPLVKSGQPLDPRSSTYQGSAPTGSSKTNVLSLQS